MSERLCNLKNAGGGGKNPVLKTVNLGTGTSINIKNHAVLGAFYDKLTINNFYQKFSSKSQTSADSASGKITVAFTTSSLSYNSSTGVLTSGNATIKASTSSFSTTATVTTTAYCVYIDYE